MPHTRLLRRASRVAAATALLILAAATPVRPQASDATPLRQGDTVERKIGGGQTARFRLELAADRFVIITVGQTGVDVSATLVGPGDAKVAEVDATSPADPEQVVVITATAGAYVLQVTPVEQRAPAGRISVTLDVVRSPTDDDRARVAKLFADERKDEDANAAFERAEELRKQGTAESLRAAAAEYETALRLWRDLGDANGQALSLDALGFCYSNLGDRQRAVELFGEALTLARADQNRALEATLLNKLGINYTELGDVQRAFDSFNQAIDVSRKAGRIDVEGAALSSLAKLYNDLGAYRKALEYLAKALPIRRKAGDEVGVARTLNNMGFALGSLGDKRRALDLYTQQLAIVRSLKNRRDEARSLNNIAFLYADAHDTARAITTYGQALAIWQEVGDRAGLANTLDNLGQAYLAAGDLVRASDYFNQALPVRRAVRDVRGEAATLYGLARVERDRGNLVEARARVEGALALVENLRAKITNQDLRASYFATVQKYFQLYVDIFMRLHERSPEAGFDRAALAVSERARARSLLDFLVEASVDVRQGVDAALVKRERTLQRDLDAKSNAMIRILSGEHAQDQVEAASTELAALDEEYDRVREQIRASSPRYAALTQPETLDVEAIQHRVLDDETALLEYSLGEERSYLWVVTTSGVQSFTLPRQAVVEARANRVRELLSVAGRRVLNDSLPRLRARVARANAALPAVAARLGGTILPPAIDALSATRVLVVADGALQYVPFGVLPFASAKPAGVPLLSRFEVVNAPSASTVAALRAQTNGRAPAPRSVALFADPVFNADDPRVHPTAGARRVAGSNLATSIELREVALDTEDPDARASSLAPRVAFGRLPATREEADGIEALVATADDMKAVDFDASLAGVSNPELNQYRVIHFATHAVVERSRPELSGIVLSLVNDRGEAQDGFLRVAEVYNLDLPAELVVLSACKSGLGAEVRGEGLVGLTRGFMYAGSPRVVVSLWSAVDESTKELMLRFYRSLLVEKMRPAAALRRAQLSMASDSRWRAPQYWAAFVIQGEWR